MIVGTNLSRYEVIKDYRKTPYQRFSNGSWSSLRNHKRRETELGKPQITSKEAT
jgi:nucleosome binding factor SPN SPT16 subunit